MDNFFGPFLARVAPGNCVLDLGAGQGTQAQWMARRGALVTAVDKKMPPSGLAGIDWIQSSIEDWFARLPAEARFDAILAKNVFQFLNRDWVLQQLLPDLAARLNPGGLMGIETFYQPPEPAFEWLTETAHYTLADLSAFFFNWKVLSKQQQPVRTRGLDGVKRKFFLTDLIVQRQAASAAQALAPAIEITEEFLSL